jgi:hypothetical protein
MLVPSFSNNRTESELERILISRPITNGVGLSNSRYRQMCNALTKACLKGKNRVLERCPKEAQTVREFPGRSFAPDAPDCSLFDLRRSDC